VKFWYGQNLERTANGFLTLKSITASPSFGGTDPKTGFFIFARIATKLEKVVFNNDKKFCLQ
jgi:hypothetical protein